MVALELIPDPFVNALGTALGSAAVGAKQTITVTGTTTWLTGENAFSEGERVFWGYLGNPHLPASMEIVRVVQTWPSIVIERGADGRTPLSHDVTQLFGPALRGLGIAALVAQAVSGASATVSQQTTALVKTATRVRSTAERIFIAERFTT